MKTGCTLLLLVSMGFFVGCGSGEPRPVVGKLRGTVTFKGAPVTDANVTFEDRKLGQLASAPLKADGTYEVKTGEGGLRVGTYSVWLVPSGQAAPSIDNMNPAPAADRKDIPKKYRDGETSGLTVTVENGTNAFDVKLEE
ncbi:hypothetical protein SH661x_000919 [Planctomicrobium sp. SH661]|uniref:hypothetical protein n=1 Tax=Planctomicrobium sp. SH661 TaxID=3448124 RepID=UPI003F5C71DB